jgi:hypothetical protein
MKVTHFVINNDSLIAVIYQSEKFGRVVVFRSNQIDLEFPIETYSPDTEIRNEEDIIELILGVLPK